MPATADSAGRSTTASSGRWNSAPTSWSTPTGTTSTRRSASATWSQPILRGEAEITIGDRQTHEIEHFSGFKKKMQQFGSWVVNKAAGTTLPDAASGFRAYSRDSLMLLNTITRFSYCMETIIQAGNKKLKIVSVPIRTNPKTRESRLFKSMREHMMKSAGAIIRSYIMYKPYAIFTFFALLFGLFGLFFFARFGILRLTGDNGEHVQSILVGAVSLIVAFLSVIIGITADLIRTNRMLIEDTLEHTKKMRFGQGSDYCVAERGTGRRDGVRRPPATRAGGRTGAAAASPAASDTGPYHLAGPGRVGADHPAAPGDPAGRGRSARLTGPDPSAAAVWVRLTG